MTHKPTDKSFGNTYLSGNTAISNLKLRILIKSLANILHKCD